nr:unnamed protein product [Haemonchus contortus]
MLQIGRIISSLPTKHSNPAMIAVSFSETARSYQNGPAKEGPSFGRSATSSTAIFHLLRSINHDFVRLEEKRKQ